MDLLSFMAFAWLAWLYEYSVTFNEPWSSVENVAAGFL